MALSTKSYTGDGSTTDYNVTFGFISRSHVYVYLDGALSTAYTWLSDTQIRFNSAVTNAVAIELRRTTPFDPLVNFSNGSTLNADTDLDVSSLQLFYLVQEAHDAVVGDVVIPDIITTAYIADSAITTAKLNAGAVTAVKMAADAVTTAKILDANVTAAKLASNAVTTAKIADGSVTAAKLDASVIAFPTGGITMYGGAAAPTGWALCNGAAYDRTNITYTALYTAIGTTFGVGGGGNDFQVPDLRGRTVIGAGNGSGLTARTLGTAAGEETHTLLTSEMPAHVHVNSSLLSLAGHGSSAGSGSYGVQNTASTGGDGPHNNMQPYTVCSYIIKL